MHSTNRSLSFLFIITFMLGIMLAIPSTIFAAACTSSITSDRQFLQEQSAYNHMTPEHYQLPQELDWSSIPAHFMEEQDPARNNQIQVFDDKKGRVVLSVPNNAAYQAEAKKWLSDITSLAPEIQPDMGATYIIRVPLEPAQMVSVGNVNLNAKEVFLFYYSDTGAEPLLLVFDENKKPYFFHIHEDVTPFLKQLQLPY